jgi:DNA-binding response OmpR family regulator
MPATSNPVRFGSFELDLFSGELRKNGMKIRLADQPLQILTLLLERPGQVVTREELRQRLWSSDTFVDFEHGLNAACVKRWATRPTAPDSLRRFPGMGTVLWHRSTE